MYGLFCRFFWGALYHRLCCRSMSSAVKRIQTFGRKRNAIAAASCVEGRGIIRVNGRPLELLEPAELRVKAFEPLLILGTERYSNLDIRVRVSGGGHTSQVYAVRQAIARCMVAWCQKYVDESTKKDIRDILVTFDRGLLVSDPRRCESKKFGGRGARARRQKSYR